MARFKIFFVLILVVLFLAAVVSVGAQEHPGAVQKEPESQKEPPYAKPYPMGQVTMTFTKIAVGVGAEWGKGVLTYKGKEYTFKVKGIQVGAVGISKATVRGDVYNLFSVAEFPGQYAAVGAGAAIIKGAERNDFKNHKNVHIVLKGTEKGVNLNIGPAGFTIAMQEAL